MTKIKTYIHGIYPRSAELIQVSRDVLRKRAKETEYKAQYKKDQGNFLKLQQELDLDFIEDGKLGWQDIFRPIVEATDGLEIGALTRWFDNNCFFRQPVLKGRLKLDEKKLDEFFPVIASDSPAGGERGNPVVERDCFVAHYRGAAHACQAGELATLRSRNDAKRWKVTLPSPFTFAKLIQNDTDWPFEKTLIAITDVIAQIVVYLEKKGVDFIQFNESFLPYHGASAEDLRLFKRAVLELEETISRSREIPRLVARGELARDDNENQPIFSLQFYFGDAAPIIEGLGKNDFIDIIGVDFYKTALSSLTADFPYGLAAGIIDGRNSLIEDKETLKRFVEKALKKIGVNDLYITNNSDLELLPEVIARKKVELLGKL